MRPGLSRKIAAPKGRQNQLGQRAVRTGPAQGWVDSTCEGAQLALGLAPVLRLPLTDHSSHVGSPEAVTCFRRLAR